MEHKKERNAIIIASVLIGLVGIIVKLVGDNVHPITLVFYRLLVATVLLFAISPFIDPDFYKINKKDTKLFAIAGLLLAGAMASFIYAVSLIPVSSVMLLTSTYIFFVVLFAYLFLNEKIKHKHLISMFLIILGMVILNPLSMSISIIGFGLTILNAIFHAGVLVYMKYEGRNHKPSSMTWTILFATLFLTPVPFIFGFGNVMEVMPHIFFLGGVSTAIPYSLLAFGIRKISTDTTAILQLAISPVTAIIFAMIFLKETLTEQMLFGGSLILIGGISLIYTISKFKEFLHKQLHTYQI